MEDQTKELKIDDLIWGKIEGYPWWPAKVFFLTFNLKLIFLNTVRLKR